MKNKKTIAFNILFYVSIFLSICIFLSTLWTLDTFGNVKSDQIIYTLLSSLDGTDSSVVISWILKVFVVAVVICLLIGILHYRWKDKVEKKIKMIASITICITLLCSLFYADNQFGIVDYINNSHQKTDIYEAKKSKKVVVKKESDGDESLIYASPGDVEITGEETNNLIYIYLESYENSFMDVENGGVKQVNCLLELTQLAKDNTHFSNSDKMGGAIAFTGTTWTMGSMVGQSSGLPLRVDIENGMDQYDRFMPGAVMIGDILAQKGYVQELMIGSTACFAGTDKMFSQHGNYKIIDYPALKSMKKVQNGDYCEWGINDQALFRNAKDELNALASSGQKFNFTIATIDAHMPKGMSCPFCPNNYGNRYENIYACQSKQVNDFIEWCKQQTWYASTTIILVGDHKTMAVDYIRDIPEDYTRTTYNCIINSKVSTENTKNRTFTQMDMFPTTLAALGFHINGNKLALGTNLFSKLPTITEKYGVEYIEQEIQKSSDYLNENIYQFNE